VCFVENVLRKMHTRMFNGIAMIAACRWTCRKLHVAGFLPSSAECTFHSSNQQNTLLPCFFRDDSTVNID